MRVGLGHQTLWFLHDATLGRLGGVWDALPRQGLHILAAERRDGHVELSWPRLPRLLSGSLEGPADERRRLLGLLAADFSISNLGSSFGTAIAGTILVSDLVSGNGTYVTAMIVLAVVALAGLAIATRLPANPRQSADSDVERPAAAAGALDTAV